MIKIIALIKIFLANTFNSGFPISNNEAKDYANYILNNIQKTKDPELFYFIYDNVEFYLSDYDIKILEGIKRGEF